MVRSRICIHVGQCGNQIAQNFWDLLLKEHADAAENEKENRFCFDGALCSMFNNLDNGSLLSIGSDVKHLKARALLIDMEERVLDHTKRSVIGPLFDSSQRISDTSGSGNNWAVGFSVYGNRYEDRICDMIQSEFEKCDYCDSFLMFHSTGGGTGSGLGSFILKSLANISPKTTRVVTAVFPSGGDDVVTSPYNSLLSMRYLSEFADMIIPIDNGALASFPPPLIGRSHSSFDPMNHWVSKLWVDLTSPLRFDSNVSQSLNSMAKHLVPSANLNFVIPSVAPFKPASADLQAESKSFDLMFTEISRKQNCLLSVDFRKGQILKSHKVVRIKSQSISDILRNVERNSSLRAPLSCEQSVSVAKAVHAPSMGSLSNSTCITPLLENSTQRFLTLYKRHANLHHYLEHISRLDFEEALEHVRTQLSGYTDKNK